MDNFQIQDFYEFCSLCGELKREVLNKGATTKEINELAKED